MSPSLKEPEPEDATHLLYEAVDIRNSESYPFNLERVQPLGRQSLLRAIKQHFDNTKLDVLIVKDKSATVARKKAIERNIKTIWFDCESGRLDQDSNEAGSDYRHPRVRHINSNGTFEKDFVTPTPSRPTEDPPHRFMYG